MSPLFIPTGRWKVEPDSANDQTTIRLSGRALFSDSGTMVQKVQTFLLTYDQALELVSGLNEAVRELGLQRTASLARAAEGEGAAGQWD